MNSVLICGGLEIVLNSLVCVNCCRIGFDYYGGVMGFVGTYGWKFFLLFLS